VKRTSALFVLTLSLFTTNFVAEVRADEEASGAAQFETAHGEFFRLLAPNPTDGGVSYLFQPGNSETDGPGEFDLHQFRLDGELPVALDQETFLRFGGEYEHRILNFDNVRRAETNQSSEYLHKLMVTVGAGTFLSKELLLTGAIRPGLLSDLDDGIRNDDFDIYGEGMAVYQLNQGAQLLLGVARREVFNSSAFYPIAGLRLRSEDGALSLSLTLPHEAKVSYNATEFVQVYGGFWLDGEEYRVDIGKSERFNLHVQDRRLGAGAVYWIDNFNVNAEAGISKNSEFEFKTAEAGQFEGSLDNAGYLTVGLGIDL
jgi:hypothetical protein